MRLAILLVVACNALQRCHPRSRRAAALRSSPDDVLQPAVPLSTDQMIVAAARSVRAAFEDGSTRQTLDLFIPLPPETDPADLDPWPGGLRQISGAALPIAREILRAAVKGGKEVQESVLSREDGVIQLYCQGTEPVDDAMLLMFAGSETFDQLVQIDAALDERQLMVLFNPQFQKAGDLGLFKRGAGKEYLGDGTLEDKFPTSYCAQELSVRSEDCRLVGAYGKGWRAYFVDDAVFEGQNMVTEGTPRPLHADAFDTRPSYSELEEIVRAELKLPVYVRKMREAADKGPRFLR